MWFAQMGIMGCLDARPASFQPWKTCADTTRKVSPKMQASPLTSLETRSRYSFNVLEIA